MRTVVILVAGWLIGGAIIMLLASASPLRPATPPVPETRPAAAGIVRDPALPIIPVAGVRPADLRDTFDAARAGHVHHALDIMAPRGTAVLASVDGSVRKLFTSHEGGLTIYEFDRSVSRVYYYAHLDRYAIGLHEGQPLHRGDVIGFVGTSGNAPPDAPHLHFSVEDLPPTKEWWKGSPINPYPLLTR